MAKSHETFTPGSWGSSNGGNNAPRQTHFIVNGVEYRQTAIKALSETENMAWCQMESECPHGPQKGSLYSGRNRVEAICQMWGVDFGRVLEVDKSAGADIVSNESRSEIAKLIGQKTGFEVSFVVR